MINHLNYEQRFTISHSKSKKTKVEEAIYLSLSNNLSLLPSNTIITKQNMEFSPTHEGHLSCKVFFEGPMKHN